MALVVGNSDGIGLALTQELLRRGWTALGISRSNSPVRHEAYRHTRALVQDDTYTEKLKTLLATATPPDLCVYCAGVGEPLDTSRMEREAEVFEVNLVGMVKTAACVIPLMERRGVGHFIGLSSLADELVSADAPSYSASKAGFSNYLGGLALALRPKGVYVTNVRFGFVDTKMAKSEVKPFMMPVDRAVRHLLTCIERKPVSYAAPWPMVPLVRLQHWIMRLKTLLPGPAPRR
ncbi:MAG: SDR family NAD(P)-dependent oxidoreductase [candidate division WOR-3 bacterium]|nr:SDR family NAD(P)-dependent oxidoreductase [candidate division WOR-3 bacterium]